MFAPEKTRSHLAGARRGVRRGTVLAYTTSPGKVKCKSRARPVQGTVADVPLPQRKISPGKLSRYDRDHRRVHRLDDRGGRLGQIDRRARAAHQIAQPIEVLDDDDLAVDQHQALLAQPPQRAVDMHEGEAEMV